mgnify:CR=1 FL=1
MIFLAKDFETRQELERKVASALGLTTEMKKGYLIKGTIEELKRLHLGEGSLFWGISAEITDPKKAEPNKKPQERANRGERHKSKMESVDVAGSKEL